MLMNLAWTIEMNMLMDGVKLVKGFMHSNRGNGKDGLI